MSHSGWKRDGLTPAKRAAVLQGLEQYGNATDSCRVAGISTTTFYRHLKKDEGFAAECAAARERGARPIEALAWERATNGTPETVIRGGEVVEVRVKPSDQMLGVLLKASNPAKYAPGAQKLREQVEKELRPAIEAELRAEMARKHRLDGPKLRREFDQLLTEYNLKMGGQG